MKLAVIGGSGVDRSPAWLHEAQEIELATPYGTVELWQGRHQELEDTVYFLPRHGKKHQWPPHRVNFRANLWSLKDLGVERIIATAAVGSMNLQMPPASFVVCDDFLDYTKSRPQTFFEGGADPVVHKAMTHAYCPA
ncbi:MAG: MTAP family purine nucleoside phosphorylase, partial [Firmicutes bacterium]|nr:MTAP family purine nucleoside phosphorylase [Bacillota bacterium]